MEIKGIGTDIIEISRIKKACNRSENFLKRVFSHSEREYFSEKKNSYQSIAGNFAAKEAVVKAFGTGFRNIKWAEVEILRDELGKPYLNPLGGFRELIENEKIETFVSISHCEEYATANVIMVIRGEQKCQTNLQKK